MSDPFLVLGRVLMLIFVPAMLIVPLVFAALVPNRAADDSARGALHSRAHGGLARTRVGGTRPLGGDDHRGLLVALVLPSLVLPRDARDQREEPIVGMDDRGWLRIGGSAHGIAREP